MPTNQHQVSSSDKASFHVVLREHATQNKGIHFHPEYQISLVFQGNGTLRIADQTQSIAAGDVFMVGPEVAHGLSCKSEHESSLHLISLYFLPDAFGDSFFQLPEMAAVQKLLQGSRAGILFDPAVSKQVKKNILRLRTTSASPQRLIMLLSILNKMSSHAWDPIARIGFSPEVAGSDSMFSQILQYIYDNFDQPISLEDMSELVNLNKYSFCRYFKRMTQMSFVSYLNEFRISKACRFLNSETYNISQIGYLVGYNTLSNFYHQFHKIMNCTPTEYREGGEFRLQEG